MLISLFESLIQKMQDEKCQRKIKLRYLNSKNKITTTRNIIYEITKCKLTNQECELLYQYIYAYFTKSNRRRYYDNSTREMLLQKQSYQCNICKKQLKNEMAELDHKVPWIFVGDELGVENLQMLCENCNKRKGKNSAYNLKMFLVNK